MVVSGGAVSPENRSNEDEAMRAEAERWLQLCGCCDAGIIGASCVCPPGDPRNVIGWALQRLAAVERERDQLRSANHAAVRLIREHGDVEVERDAALARIAAVKAVIGDCAGHLHIPAEVRACPYCRVRAVLSASQTQTGGPTTDAVARILARHQLADVLPGGVACTCGAELAALNPPLDDGAIKGEPLALAVHQIQEIESAVGAASPTPTGPEPARCEHGWTEPHSFYVAEGRDWDHSAEYATCPGPATPEPTEETP